MEPDVQAIVSHLQANGNSVTYAALREAMAFPKQGQFKYALDLAKAQGLVKARVKVDPDTKAVLHTVELVV